MKTRPATNPVTAKYAVSVQPVVHNHAHALAVLLTAGQVPMQWRIGAAQNEIMLVR